jgi:hypothetical protein
MQVVPEHTTLDRPRDRTRVLGREQHGFVEADALRRHEWPCPIADWDRALSCALCYHV